MNIETIDSFNKFAEQYADFTFSSILQYELNRFIAFLPKKAKILDLCCGSGRDVQYFLDYGHKPLGIDASKNMIKEAKRLVPEGKFKVMHLESLDFKPESYHAAWALDALSYIPRTEIPKILKTLHEIFKKDGIIFTSVRQGEGEQIIEYEKLGKSQIKVTFFQQKELEDLFVNAGFEILNSFIQEGEDFKWINIYAKKK